MSYSIKFEMCPNPWRAGLIIFDDGQAKLSRHLISPDRPVLVQLEGLKRNALKTNSTGNVRPQEVKDALQGLQLTAAQAACEADGLPVNWKAIAEHVARDAMIIVRHMCRLEDATPAPTQRSGEVDEAATAKALDDLASKLSAVLDVATGGVLSNTHYDILSLAADLNSHTFYLGSDVFDAHSVPSKPFGWCGAAPQPVYPGGHKAGDA